MNEKRLALAPQDIIAEIRCESSAWAEAFLARTERKSLREIAEEVEYDKGNLSRFLDEQVGVPKNRAAALMREFGNALPLQYMAFEVGLAVIDADELSGLFNELERLRGCQMTKQPRWSNRVPSSRND